MSSFLAKVRRVPAAPVLLVAFAACILWAKPMGLLLWARIRILTNIPRTAIAEPEAESAALRIELPEAETVGLPTRPARDPFRHDSAKAHEPHNPTLPDPKAEGDLDGGAKSDGPSADEPDASRSDRSAQARPVLHRLHGTIESVPLAIIDGRAFRIGDTIVNEDGSEPFRLVELSTDAAVLERTGQRVELRMVPSVAQ